MRSQQGVVEITARVIAKERGVTQVDIACQLGITQQAVSQKLAGKRPFTKAEIGSLAEMLGVHPGEPFAVREPSTSTAGARGEGAPDSAAVAS